MNGVEQHPDFGGMKTPELVNFFANAMNENEGLADDLPKAIKEFKALKVAEKKTYLKALFPDPKGLDSPAVTGMDITGPIDSTVVEVQKLESEESAVIYLQGAQDTAQFNFFKVGGVLAQMQAKGWVGEFPGVYERAEAEFGIARRKAQTLIQIYHALVGCGATWEEAKPLGWAKMSRLAPVVTPENYKEWFAACGEAASFAMVEEMVKKAKAESSATPGGSTPIKKKTIKIHEDQEEVIDLAFEKAKAASGTTFDGPALEYICLDFLNSGKVAAVGDDEEAVTVLTDPAVMSFDGFTPTADNLLAMFSALRTKDAESYELILGAFVKVFDEIHLVVHVDGEPDPEPCTKCGHTEDE